MTTSAFWSELWSALDEIDAQTAELRRLAATGEDALAGLVPLHDTLLQRISSLMARLTGGRPPETNDPVFQALAYAFDERVMVQLPEEARIHWPFVQASFFGVVTGGERFFALVEMALADPAIGPTAAREVLCFFLSNGFAGMHVGRPEAVRHTLDGLRRAIGKPVPIDEPEAGSGAPRRREEGFAPVLYYLLAVCLTFIGVVGMTVLTNLE